MCGFAGIIDLSGRREPEREIVERMGDAIAHRGPDGSGFFSIPGVAISHRRLSIVGVIDGHQPLFNEDHTVAVLALRIGVVFVGHPLVGFVTEHDEAIGLPQLVGPEDEGVSVVDGHLAVGAVPHII